MNTEQFDRIWQKQMAVFDHGSDTAGYWNRRARTFESAWRTSNYSQELIKRLELKPEYSVLDVACGTGTVAVPLAKRVAGVTALDISASMLASLKRKAVAAGLTNLTIINKDWNEISIPEDIDIHDAVLVSRSLPGHRLSETLSKLDMAASRACYITWRTERSNKADDEVAAVLGKPIRSYPDYNIIFEMALSMGFAARLDIFESTSEECFPTLEEAVAGMSRDVELSNDQRKQLAGIAAKRFTIRDSAYYNKYKMKWSLIYWHKSCKGTPCKFMRPDLCGPV